MSCFSLTRKDQALELDVCLPCGWAWLDGEELKEALQIGVAATPLPGSAPSRPAPGTSAPARETVLTRRYREGRGDEPFDGGDLLDAILDLLRG